MGVWYASREDVKRALGVENNRSDADVDRAIESGSRLVEAKLHRRFYPEVATRYFDYLGPNFPRSWRLSLHQNELVSVTSVTTNNGSTTLSQSGYFLRRTDNLDEAPYDQLQLDRGTSASFSSGSTSQKAIGVTGVYGYRNDEAQLTTITSSVNTSVTTLAVGSSTFLGVGDLIRLENERLLVAGKNWVDSTKTISSGFTASAGDNTIPVGSNSVFSVGDVIRVDSEQMLVTDLVGSDTVVVVRGFNATVLDTHSPLTAVYALTSLSVTRGVLGTTAAAHNSAVALYKVLYPAPVRSLAIAYAINQLQQESAAYARVAGTGETAQEFTGRGIGALEDSARAACGRQARVRSV